VQRPLLAGALLLTAAPVAAAEGIKIAVIPTQLEASAKGMVPALFDDYLLTAVQNTSEAQVIGQDDIGAMLGFEQQKDLMNCDDTSCMADIGGALGVDKIVSVKIARLGEDWVATAKLINIKTTRVEARVNEIVGGDTKALLHAVTPLIAKLFGKPVPSAAPQGPAPNMAPRAAQKAPAMPQAQTAPGVPNDAYGRGPRIGGTVMLAVGAGLGLIGGLWATSIDSCTGDEDEFDTTCSLDTLWYTYSTILIVAGEVLVGVGAKLRANGAVRRDLGNPNISGSPAAYWLGWLLAAGTIAAPFTGFLDLLDRDTAEMMGWGCGLGSLAVFFIGSVLAPQPNDVASLDSVVQPSIGFARLGADQLTPTFGLAAGF
jgi:hypothetical protein